MTPLERKYIYRAYNLLNEPYVHGNRERLGTVGQLNLTSAITWLSRALENDDKQLPTANLEVSNESN